MAQKKINFHDTNYSSLVQRRDYSKIQTNFEEPDLLEVQRNSYSKFLEEEIESLVKNYFPVKHAKNNKYEVQYHGIKFADPIRTEKKARSEGKSYEKALYVDLSLVNNETGEVKRAKKTKTNICEGIFFANIPIMTEKGTFIVNGIEKFVISQIVRSPGAYILAKSQIKLSSKKKVNEGFICEVLPSRGTLMNFWIDESDKRVVAAMRNTTGDSVVTFPATQLLKAFGMGQDEIRRLYRDDEYIINTLFSEQYNHNNILEDFEIIGIRKNAGDIENTRQVGSPIDTKLKQAVVKFEKNRKTRDALRQKYDSMFSEISEEYTRINSEIKIAKGEAKEKLEKQIKKLSSGVESTLNELNEIEIILKNFLDTIITEKAAKDLITLLSISTKSIESFASNSANPICYQDVLSRHFMDPRQYDLTSAGRYKIHRKLRVSERLYQRIIAEDLVSKSGKVIVREGTLILKEEIDLIKKHLATSDLKVLDEIKLNNESIIQKKQSKLLEIISVYTNNDSCDVITPIIAHFDKDNSLSLTIADFLSIISYTINLPHEIGSYDDIDHLGNKRIRLIHEQLKNKLQIGMARVEKHIKEKLASISIATANDEQQAKVAAKTTIKSVANTKAFQLVVKNFFNSYQLTQFIDQQNPLAELTNKRRISAMGDGGISREDPNLDIRDVHYSHYGRICPIETPEGMNIGLIMSLAAFTKVDENGFLITPYRKVVKGVISKNVEWLTSLREDEYVIVESTVPQDENGRILVDKIIGRYRSSQELFRVDQIDYVDVSPRQVVSIAAGAIPFLENDDTTRALMGANMQRQAVPLLKPYAPIIGTGSEYKIAHDSGMTIVAKEAGTVEKVDGNEIVIKNSKGKQTYELIKYRKSNQDTCINQTPIVMVGDKIKVGDTLTDGPAMHNGELALGRNPLVAFTTWNGYNYEDAIIVSDRLVSDDVYTSISIEEHTVECLRTKNGDEEITRELPNVSEDAKRYLDEDGVIMVGAEVKEGDILVGKISPKGQTEFSAEEKLLQAIFGNKTKNFRELSLKVPHGGEGIVAKIQRFSIMNNDELDDDVIELIKIFIVQKRKIQIGDKMSGRHGNKGIVSIVVPVADMPHLEDGTPMDILLNPLGVPSRMNIGQILELHLGYAMREIAKKKIITMATDGASASKVSQAFGIENQKAEPLLNAIEQYSKNKKKITDIDLQIILAQVGLSFEDLLYKVATPVFHGANLEDIESAFIEAGIDPIKTKGKFKLIDGRSGEYFDGDVTVGIMYMMKLDHMVDDKIHARAVGPYSKITQQPLGGKSQNGGQRFGEMEVWALEAYGAAYNLRELLTIKSDDVKGRNLTYSAIVKGKPFPIPNIPESFKLLTKQLQGLALTVNVIKEDGNTEDINNYTSVISDDELKEDVGRGPDELVSVQTFDNEQDNEDTF